MGLYHRQHGYATPAKFLGRKRAGSRAAIRKAKKLANRYWDKYYFGGYE